MSLARCCRDSGSILQPCAVNIGVAGSILESDPKGPARKQQQHPGQSSGEAATSLEIPWIFLCIWTSYIYIYMLYVKFISWEHMNTHIIGEARVWSSMWWFWLWLGHSRSTNYESNESFPAEAKHHGCMYCARLQYVTIMFFKSDPNRSDSACSVCIFIKPSANRLYSNPIISYIRYIP